jgi:hypothetical protein
VGSKAPLGKPAPPEESLTYCLKVEIYCTYAGSFIFDFIDRKFVFLDFAARKGIYFLGLHVDISIIST